MKNLSAALRGAVVYVTALTEEEAQIVVGEILALGSQAVAEKLDVTDEVDVY